MKLADAKPGDVMRDKDGDVWLCFGNDTLVCIAQDGEPQWELRGRDVISKASAGKFGPFTRLVPEKETP